MNPNTPRKHSALKVVLLIVAIIVGLVAAVVIFLYISFTNIVDSHNNELGRLEKETISIFTGSDFAASSYDCHDVELKNRCYFILSAPLGNLEAFLQQKGFSKDTDSGPGSGFRKDDLYIENLHGDENFSSYHIVN